MAREQTARTEPFGDLLDRILPRDSGRFRASSASVVDPAAIFAEVFNVEPNLDSPQALIAQITSAVPLEEETTTAPDGKPCVCPTHPHTVAGIGPYAATATAAQVLQENVAQLANVEPLEITKVDGCDHRTILALIRSSVATIVKDLTRPVPPLPERVNAQLAKLVGYDPKDDPKPFSIKDVRGDLGTLYQRLALDHKPCSVRDERTLIAFSNVVQFANMVVQSWHAAVRNDKNFLTIAIHGLQRHLRGVAGAAEHLRAKVPAGAWASELSDPPIVAGDLYRWVHDYATDGALYELKFGGRDGILNVNRTMTEIKAVVERAFKADDTCNKAFRQEDVTKIVTELICHIDKVITVTKELL